MQKTMTWPFRARNAAEDDQTDDEGYIMRRARADPAAFAPLYERYFPRIYAYCRRRVESAEEAEDLTSLVFTRALGGLHDQRGGSVAAWLFRIAHNAVVNHRRDRRPEVALDPTALAEASALTAPDDDTVERLMRDEAREQVARLIAALPDEQRELLTLKVTGELSAGEIGAVLGKSEGAVRVALHRVVQGLRAAYRQAAEEGKR